MSLSSPAAEFTYKKFWPSKWLDILFGIDYPGRGYAKYKWIIEKIAK